MKNTAPILISLVIALLAYGFGLFFTTQDNMLGSIISTFIAGISTIVFSKLTDKPNPNEQKINDAIPIVDENKLEEEINPNDFDTKPNTDTDNSDSKRKLNVLNTLNAKMSTLETYYNWSRKLSEYSFVFAVFLSIVGLIIIACAIFNKEISKEGQTLGVIGGIVAEFLSGTALLIFKVGVKQMKHYHKTLHEDERVYISLAIAEKLSGKERNQMYAKVIENELKTNLREIELYAVSEKEDNKDDGEEQKQEQASEQEQQEEND